MTRILVVDDNRDGADSLAILLDIYGNEVRTAYDGLQAVALAEEFRPDLILMDVTLPLLDGLSAARRIKSQQPWGREITIYAVTGYGDEETKQASRAAGCERHLTKPLDPTQLQKVVSCRSADHCL